ncbi:MAG: cytochrome P450 [Acidimicrobiia bacterium]|nr:cytochrome P450 [Acidimicrobiia bacterium]
MTDVDSTEAGEVDAVVFELMATPEGRADPYPRYERLRALGRASRSAEVPVWYLTGFDDCHQVLRDLRFGKGSRLRSIVAGSELPETDDGRRRSMLFMNPPDHTRLRGLVSRAFTPRRVEQLHDNIVTMVDELLDPLLGAGPVDLMEALAYPLPVRVISELIGVPAADRDRFRSHTAKLVTTLEPVYSQDQQAEAEAAAIEFGEYFSWLIDERRVRPADDLLTGLVQARDGDDALTHDELIATLILIYAAGFETTTNLIGNGIWTLLRHPDQLAHLRRERSLVPNAVEEILRVESPVQIDGREAFETIEVAGTVIPAGESVITLLGAANRDPQKLVDPHVFDITREDVPVLSFASGIHFCLGASLARLEGRVVLDRVLDRFDTITVVEEPTWKANLTLRGLESLLVDV